MSETFVSFVCFVVNDSQVSLKSLILRRYALKNLCCE
jgi:hypothetical protein